ncbi:MAG TPA: radical SAM protein [Candidatus Limnocylindrales bacterium]|nr:radical SAM protein [Candidatus Limnocylindrales bacterium]
MFVRPRVLSILTTRRCTARCDHCCVGAGPRATGTLTVPRIRALLEEATSVPTIERIVFTGGEAFLLGDDLTALVTRAHGLGFATRAITNGFWARDAVAADRRIGALAEAGLDELMFSTGTFHQAFVPVGHVVNGARAAVRAGLATRVSVETCDQSSFGEAALRADLRDELASGMLAVSSDPWITDAGGRGSSRLTHERLRAAHGDGVRGGCATIMTTLSVTPDQELVACCGFPLEELPGLRIGSIAQRALGDVIRDAPNDALKMFLHVAGPAGIAEFVARYEPGYSLPGNPISICEACVALQRDTRAMRIAAEHVGAIATELAARFTAQQYAFTLPTTPTAHARS